MSRMVERTGKLPKHISSSVLQNFNVLLNLVCIHVALLAFAIFIILFILRYVFSASSTIAYSLPQTFFFSLSFCVS